MIFNKEDMLSCIEVYLRDKSKDGLYDAFEYIGDSVSTQDLIMAEEDNYYLDYLVHTVLDEVGAWSEGKIKDMIKYLGIDLVSQGN